MPGLMWFKSLRQLSSKRGNLSSHRVLTHRMVWRKPLNHPLREPCTSDSDHRLNPPLWTTCSRLPSLHRSTWTPQSWWVHSQIDKTHARPDVPVIASNRALWKERQSKRNWYTSRPCLLQFLKRRVYFYLHRQSSTIRRSGWTWTSTYQLCF